MKICPLEMVKSHVGAMWRGIQSVKHVDFWSIHSKLRFYQNVEMCLMPLTYLQVTLWCIFCHLLPLPPSLSLQYPYYLLLYFNIISIKSTCSFIYNQVSSLKRLWGGLSQSVGRILIQIYSGKGCLSFSCRAFLSPRGVFPPERTGRVPY